MSILKRTRRREDGAVALEAALVTPILLILVFGIIEFSFALRDHIVVVSDTRVGARIAAAGASFGKGLCLPLTPGDEPSEIDCVPEAVPALAQAAAKAIQRSGTAMPMENINYILVYRAEANGKPVNSDSVSSCGGVDCVKFRWRKNAGEFRYDSGSWNSSTISACFPGKETLPGGKKQNLESVGVYMNATYKAMTGFFFNSLTIDDHAVMNFEPLPSDQCGEGQHS